MVSRLRPLSARCVTSLNSKTTHGFVHNGANVAWALPPRVVALCQAPEHSDPSRASEICLTIGVVSRLGQSIHDMTRIVRTARLSEPENIVLDRVQNFFSQHPKLQVKALGSSTAVVEVQHYLLYDWLSVAPRKEGVAFGWRPVWRGFPAFGATLTVRRRGTITELVLEGSYEPPGGAVGRLFDRVIGRKLAAATMDAFLNQVTR